MPRPPEPGPGGGRRGGRGPGRGPAGRWRAWRRPFTIASDQKIDRTLARVLGCRDVDHDVWPSEALIELYTTIDSYRGECSLMTPGPRPSPPGSSGNTCGAAGWSGDVRRAQRRGELRLVAPAKIGSQAAMHSLVARIGTLLDRLEQEKSWTFLLHGVGQGLLREVASITGTSVSAAQTPLRGRRELHALVAADQELKDLLDKGGNRG